MSGRAKAAYAAYGEVVGWKNFRGDPMPQFNELPEAIQRAWDGACEGALRHWLDNDFKAAANDDVRVEQKAAWMLKIGELIRTQDNRCTSDPLFLVQQKKRIWGMDSDHCDDYEWLAEDDHEQIAEGVERAGCDALYRNGEDVPGWRKMYYVDQWDFVTICFTEQACKDYIAAHGHNLNEPRIYAASAYRNREMIAIREMLKSA